VFTTDDSPILENTWPASLNCPPLSLSPARPTESGTQQHDLRTLSLSLASRRIASQAATSTARSCNPAQRSIRGIRGACNVDIPRRHPGVLFSQSVCAAHASTTSDELHLQRRLARLALAPPWPLVPALRSCYPGPPGGLRNRGERNSRDAPQLPTYRGPGTTRETSWQASASSINHRPSSIAHHPSPITLTHHHHPHPPPSSSLDPSSTITVPIHPSSSFMRPVAGSSLMPHTPSSVPRPDLHRARPASSRRPRAADSASSR
jgi:hypothetical protein